MKNDNRWILVCLLLAMIVSCARMGQPDGGWYDDTPPRVVHTDPADKGTGVKSKKVTITFDEFIKLEDATSKVVISPPQIEPADIKASGKKIVVELKDSLMDNTTYTIDFSDAISDNNEGNPMGNYTYSFSTGERIDTFEVSGNVLDATNLEPIKGILVGLYDDLSDTVFARKPFIRVSRTDSRGRFVIRGIAPGTYRVYALQDADGNYIYSQKSEMLAFSHETFNPYAKPDIRQDTVWRDTLRIDSIIRTPYTHFYPDDIVLRAFTALQTDRYLVKSERAEPNKLNFYFSYGNDSLPQLRGLNFNSDSAFVVDSNLKNDTITYWIKDTTLINTDSLTLEARYLITDSTGTLVMQTDTLEMIPKMSYERRMKQEEKENEKWLKEQEKKKKKGEAYDSIMPLKPLEPQISGGGTITPEQNIFFTMPTPLQKCDTSAIHLYSKIDTLWYKSRFEWLPVPGNIKKFELRAEWRPDIEYSLEVDSAAFVDIYGLVSKSIKQGIKVSSNDEFGSLIVNVSGQRDSATVIVQLLGSNDNVQKEAKVVDGAAEFFYLKAGKYYLKAFVDNNDNGLWDTGDYYADLQPEDVYYYPKEVECKEKWDITIGWDLNATPVARQKPQAITKQKSEQEKKLRNRNADRAKELGIEYKREINTIKNKVLK
ncbi:MAG: Ig-like domain-containing protein [Prevotellaceae bacterium]|nr:Ig-like domain-containing protein [Prevotellaceae bacterium]MDD6780350.1 Ig-like domain-containing protein [Prevotellaceae bacterium]